MAQGEAGTWMRHDRWLRLVRSERLSNPIETPGGFTEEARGDRVVRYRSEATLASLRLLKQAFRLRSRHLARPVPRTDDCAQFVSEN
jgi:hypothetical protein